MSQGTQNFTYVETVRGGQAVHHEGYKFTVVKKSRSAVYYRCANGSCPVKSKVANGVLYVNPEPKHSHPEDPAGFATDVVRAVAKRKLDSLKTAKQAYVAAISEVVQTHGIQAASSSATYASMHSSLRRHMEKKHLNLKGTKAMSSKMKAIRVDAFGGPEVCLLATDVDKPKPTDNQVLIRVHYAGVNPVDTYIRAGGHTVKPALPYTPGQDCAGVVEAVGSTVRTFKVGDRVYTAKTASGAYAEYTVAEQQHVFLLHESHSFAQGASIGVPYYTAYRALFIKAQAKPGMKVLIHGASGGVGLAATQMARTRGLTVYATAGTAEGMSLVEKNGAHFVYNHRDADYVEQIKAATGGVGVDVIIEMLANVNLQTDLQLLAPRGIVAVVGNRGPVQIDPRVAMLKETAIIGVMLFCSSEEDWQEMRAAMWSGASERWMTPVVAKEYALSEAAAAHRDIIESPGARGNLVLKVISGVEDVDKEPPSPTLHTPL